jgi:hypothetical protein
MKVGKSRGRTDKMRPQRALIAALSADVDRQLSSAETAAAAQSTRASILIGAAGLTSGFQVSGFSFWPALLAAIAALFGVALLTMRMASEVPIPEAEITFWQDPPDVALRNLLHWKNDVLAERESSLKSRRWVLLIGFALLASSICLELILSAASLLQGGGE